MRNEGYYNGFNNMVGTNRLLTGKDIKRFNKMYASKKKNSLIVMAVDDKTDKIVGVASFGGEEKGRVRHRVEAGWSVRLGYARRGIATRLLKRIIVEARRRGFKRIEAECAVINTASVRLAKKCGFKIEGRKSAGLLLDNGKYVDSYILGKLLR
jgi:RimJ/RimL family protein N-acetyltransferase